MTMGKRGSPLPTEEAVKAKKWKATSDEMGRTYYYHQETRETRWEKPAGFDEAQSPRSPPRTWRVTIHDAGPDVGSPPGDGDTPEEEALRDVEDPTALVDYLRRKQWAGALRRVRKHPREARVWTTRGVLRPAPSAWKVLPLHAAIILGAPAGLVGEILDSYPGAARRRDLNGSLPIHLAVRALGNSSYPTSEQVFRILLAAYSNSRNAEDGGGKTPVELLLDTELWKDRKDVHRRDSILEMLSTEPEGEGIETTIEFIPQHGNGSFLSELELQRPNTITVEQVPTASTVTMNGLSSSYEEPSKWVTETREPCEEPSKWVTQKRELYEEPSTWVTQKGTEDECYPTVASTATTTTSIEPLSKPSTITSSSDKGVPRCLELPKGVIGTLSDIYHSSLSDDTGDSAYPSPRITGHDSPRCREPTGIGEPDESGSADRCILEKFPSDLFSVQESSECSIRTSMSGDEKLEQPQQDVPPGVASSGSATAKAKAYFRSTFSVYRLKSELLNLSRLYSTDSTNCSIKYSMSEDDNLLQRKRSGESHDYIITSNTFPQDITQPTPAVEPLSRLIKKKGKEEERNGASALSGSKGAENTGAGRDPPRHPVSTSAEHALADEATSAPSLMSTITPLGSSLASWQNMNHGASSAIDDEAGPTVLFMCLYKKDWATALHRLSEHPAESSIWLSRTVRGYRLWHLLPLHASIVMGAPSYLVLELLNAYPRAAQCRDMSGSLPIHLAAARAGDRPSGGRVLNHLMRAFPDSIGVEDGEGRTAMDIARSKGVDIDLESFTMVPEEDFMLGYADKFPSSPVREKAVQCISSLTRDKTVSDDESNEPSAKSENFSIPWV